MFFCFRLFLFPSLALYLRALMVGLKILARFWVVQDIFAINVFFTFAEFSLGIWNFQIARMKGFWLRTVLDSGWTVVRRTSSLHSSEVFFLYFGTWLIWTYHLDPGLELRWFMSVHLIRCFLDRIFTILFLILFFWKVIIFFWGGELTFLRLGKGFFSPVVFFFSVPSSSVVLL